MARSREVHDLNLPDGFGAKQIQAEFISPEKL